MVNPTHYDDHDDNHDHRDDHDAHDDDHHDAHDDDHHDLVHLSVVSHFRCCCKSSIFSCHLTAL